jgi:hypothetical protein
MGKILEGKLKTISGAVTCTVKQDLASLEVVYRFLVVCIVCFVKQHCVYRI